MGAFNFRNLGIIMLMSLASALLIGCATADKEPLVKGVTSVRPNVPSAVASNPGSLFPTVGTSSGSFRPLFEDPRARNVGDTLTVVLNESTVAKRSNSAAAAKSSKIETTADLSALSNVADVIKGVPGSGIGRSLANRAAAAGRAIDGVTVDASNEFEGKGSAAAQNAFTGTVQVTVLEVLPNGNLMVVGEKQLAVSAEEEVIRISGVVNPATLVRNSVNSSQVADLRLEYRGRGFGDDTNSPGWLTGLLLKLSPF